ncbi:MAG: hypothetical protein IKJ84_05705 [Oscillospiraceae bacterium]|nr:hypothetical protein [Oscillospiraceae bacterium]
MNIDFREWFMNKIRSILCIKYEVFVTFRIGSFFRLWGNIALGRVVLSCAFLPEGGFGDCPRFPVLQDNMQNERAAKCIAARPRVFFSVCFSGYPLGFPALAGEEDDLLLL